MALGVNVLTFSERVVVNSEGFLAEVFHPWVRWEGPGSGFENSSGGAGAGGAGGGGAQKSGFFQTPFFCGFLKN